MNHKPKETKKAENLRTEIEGNGIQTFCKIELFVDAIKFKRDLFQFCQVLLQIFGYVDIPIVGQVSKAI
jgi:hypothetical protein